jgi:hypothetical protein
MGDAHSSSAGLLANSAPRMSAGSDITQALSSRSSTLMCARPAGSVNGDGGESGSLRRSMSTGDERELREAVIPSLLHCGVKESNIDWFMSRFNKDRSIDRTYTEDRILKGFSGWHTHLAGDEASSSALPSPSRETMSPLSSLTQHLPSSKHALKKSVGQVPATAAGPSFGPSPADSAALQQDGTESCADPGGTTRRSYAGDTEDAGAASASVDICSTAASAALEVKATTGREGTAKPDTSPGLSAASSKDPVPASALPGTTLPTPFSSATSLPGRGSNSTLPETTAAAAHRPQVSMPVMTSVPSRKGIRESVQDGIREGIQGIHSRAASLVGPISSSPASNSFPDIKFRVLGPGIAGASLPYPLLVLP